MLFYLQLERQFFLVCLDEYSIRGRTNILLVWGPRESATIILTPRASTSGLHLRLVPPCDRHFLSLHGLQLHPCAVLRLRPCATPPSPPVVCCSPVAKASPPASSLHHRTIAHCRASPLPPNLVYGRQRQIYQPPNPNLDP
jgi:hypothetical protein